MLKCFTLLLPCHFVADSLTSVDLARDTAKKSAQVGTEETVVAYFEVMKLKRTQ
jgi:hypothetical protein